MPSRSAAQKRANSKVSDKKLFHFPAKKSGQLKEPRAPMPAQQQPKPGIEANIEPRPKYKAPLYKGSEKLLDKVALITGADSGIGRAVAVLYAREGADVAIIYLAEEQQDASETKAAVEEEGRECLLIPGDVSDPKFCRKAVQQTVKNSGSSTFSLTTPHSSSIRSASRTSLKSSGSGRSEPTSSDTSTWPKRLFLI